MSVGRGPALSSLPFLIILWCSMSFHVFLSCSSEVPLMSFGVHKEGGWSSVSVDDVSSQGRTVFLVVQWLCSVWIGIGPVGGGVDVFGCWGKDGLLGFAGYCSLAPLS